MSLHRAQLITLQIVVWKILTAAIICVELHILIQQHIPRHAAHAADNSLRLVPTTRKTVVRAWSALLMLVTLLVPATAVFRPAGVLI